MQIEGVSVINGKTISKWNGERYVEHTLTKGIEVIDQIARVFKLVELVEVTPAEDALGKANAVLLTLNKQRSALDPGRTTVLAPPTQSFDEESS